MNSDKFAIFIKENREKLGWNVTKLARKLGVDRKTINNWEAGNALSKKIEKFTPALKEVFQNGDSNNEIKLDNVFKNGEDDVDQKEFSDFIQYMRKTVGWSKQQLGREIGYTENTIRRWEETGLSVKVDQYEIEKLIRDAVKEEIQNKRKIKNLINKSCTLV